jgi:hypothetical protein
MLKTANEHYHANRLTVLAQKRNYWSLNAVRLKANRQRKRQELRLRLLVHYGGGAARCVCCLESESMFLSIDHIANNGADHRREIGVDALHRWLEKNNYPEGYQTMCMNCNWGKHRNGGICPHKGGR